MCLMIAIQWSGTVELVSLMEQFHSCLPEVFGGREGRGGCLVLGSLWWRENAANLCYKKWRPSGTRHLGGLRVKFLC